MTRPPWLEQQKRVVKLSRAAVKALEAGASVAGVGFSKYLDAFVREAHPISPQDGAQVVMARLDADVYDMVAYEELSDDVPGP